MALRIVLFLFSCATPALAGQTVSTTAGAIAGTVTDATGSVLQGATVSISSDALMFRQTAVTDHHGRYRFPVVPPGEYVLVFTLQGFKTLNRSNIYVGLGFTATVNAQLDLAGSSQDVTVEGRPPLADAESTAVITRFDLRELADLPSARSMWALLAATPAVQVGRFDVGGNTSVTGIPFTVYGTASPNRPMVEGISVAGITPTGFTLDYGSFSEVSIGTAAHSADWPMPGVLMQFLVKSGGNKYHGSLYADYGDNDWQSFNIDATQVRRGAGGGGVLSPRETNRLWRYYDINGDVGGYILRDALWWYFSLRDQEVSARFVNFPVIPHRTHLTNYSAKTTYQVTPRHKFILFAQVGRNHQPTRLDPFGPVGGGLTATTVINESIESTTDQSAWGRIWKGEWNGIFGDHLFVELRAGQFAADRHEMPHGDAPRFEDVGNLTVRGSNRDLEQRLRREQVFGSLSYFKDDAVGSHHFKVGGDVLRTIATEHWRRGYPGDVLHVFRNGLPIEVYLFQTPSLSESGVWTMSAYAMDSWQLNAQMTVNLGLRVDRYQAFLPAQVHRASRFNPTSQMFAAVDDLIHWNVVAPRIGVAHDLTGDGKTLAKVNYARYWIAPGTDLGFNASPNASPWWRSYRWLDPDGSGVWEPGEEGPLLRSRGGVAMEGRDPQLKLPYMREVTASLERELPAGFGLRTVIVWRGERQHYMRQNANHPFDAFVVPEMLIDVGPDGTAGTPDDGPPIFARNLRADLAGLPPVNVVRNVPDADSRYWTWEIGATKRFNGRWSFAAGFAHTWSGDQSSAYFGQSVRNNMYPVSPNDLINAGKNGRYDFRTWSAKIHGTYQAPWDIRITPFLRHQSGQPFGRTFVTDALNYASSVRILAEPLESRRMDNVTLVDLRCEKGFHLRSGARVAAFVDTFNLLNANPEQNINWSSGESFLRPLNIVPPRLARVGAKLEW